MGRSITIRNVPEETHAELVARADRAGQSLQEFLRGHLITLVSKPDMKTLMGQIEQRIKRTGTNVSIETILSDLDAERQ